MDLLGQLGRNPVIDATKGISPAELAATVVRTLNLPEIRELRPRLVPEYTVYGRQSSMNPNPEILISGIADAVAADATGRIEVIIDWKSDVLMNGDKLNAYSGQLDAYRKNTGAGRVLLVLMTTGKVIELG